MMLLRCLTSDGNLVRSAFRSYVSVVSVNVKSMKSIRVKSRDVFASDEKEIKITVQLDDQSNKIDVAKLDSFKVISTNDIFSIDCNEPEKFSVIVDVPLTTCPEIELSVVADSSNVSVEDIPTKSVDVRVKSGDISFKVVKGHTIRAETEKGDIHTKGLLLAQKTQLFSKNGVSRLADMRK